MKNRLSFAIIFTVILPMIVRPQIPRTLSYQGVLADSAGNAFPDGMHSFAFAIFVFPAGGSTLWSEEKELQVSRGLFSTVLGDVNPLPDSLKFDAQYFLAVECDHQGEMSPRIPFASVAYSLASIRADESKYALSVPDNSIDNQKLTDGSVSSAKIAEGSAVKSLNSLTDRVTLAATGGATIFSSRDTIIINAGAGNSGIMSIQNTNNTLDITSPSGPTVTMNVKDDLYVRREGPDSVSSSSGMALLCKMSGSSAAPVYGIQADASNSSAGEVTGGYFKAGGSGYGAHWGSYGYSTADNATAVGAYGYGASSSRSNGIGVEGVGVNTYTGGAYGGLFSAHTSGSGIHYGVWASETAGGSGAAVYASGDFQASGTKSAVLRTSSGDRLYYSQESPEVWFEDFGEGATVNGSTRIELDPIFLETVTIDSRNPMKVFVQLEGDCNGVFITKGTGWFEVTELKGGSSSVPFSYRVVAKRRGFENERMRLTPNGRNDPNLYPAPDGSLLPLIEGNE